MADNVIPQSNGIQTTLHLATRATEHHRNGLITVIVTVPEFVHTHLLRHKRLTFNWMSHRAASTQRFADIGCFIPPIFYGKAKGMQAGDPLPPDVQEKARQIWVDAYHASLQAARDLDALGVCKSQSSRKQDTTQMMKGIITGTEDAWRRVLRLRRAPGADPASQMLANALDLLFQDIQWTHRAVHVPFWTPELDPEDHDSFSICAARIARISYGEPGQRQNDLELAGRLLRPPDPKEEPHWSPFEAIAWSHEASLVPMSAVFSKKRDISQGDAWWSLRAQLEHDEPFEWRILSAMGDAYTFPTIGAWR